MTAKLRKTIAWWQTACAILGLLVFAAAGANLMPNGRYWLTQIVGPVSILAGVAFYCLAIGAGRGLLQGARWAVLTSVLIQLMQAVSFAVLDGPVVRIAAGPAVDVTFGSAKLAAQVGFHSSFFVGTRVQGDAWEVTINLLALIWAVMLVRMLRRPPVESPSPAT
jgi:hypothetical protein